jgi:hypothetical protein
MFFSSHDELKLLTTSLHPAFKILLKYPTFFISKNGIAKPNEKSVPKEIDQRRRLQLMVLDFLNFTVLLRNAFIPAHDLWHKDINGEC